MASIFSLSNLPMLLSLSKEARAIWDSLDGTDRERLDALVRKAVNVLPTPAKLAQVKGYLANGNDPLPVRIAGTLFHPEVRSLVASGDWGLDVGVQAEQLPDPGIYNCPHCGALSAPKAVEAGREYACPTCNKTYSQQ